MIRSIGGFFEFEFPDWGENYHPEAIPLTSARSCLSLILQVALPSKIYVPYYICDSALSPIFNNNLVYEFYPIDINLELSDFPRLKQNEYILYVNYFGLKTKYINLLYEKFGSNLIIDNTHAFFEKRYYDCWSFNSVRKFFGVPDGGFIYSPQTLLNIEKKNYDIQYQHLLEKYLGNQNAYQLYLKSEDNISLDILRMSCITEKILSSINYSHVIDRRIENFKTYQSFFSDINLFHLEPYNCIPFCYPLLLNYAVSRENLAKKNIYIPTFWYDTVERNISNFDFEKKISTNLLPLPIDHRYNESDCNRVIEFVFENMHN